MSDQTYPSASTLVGHCETTHSVPVKPAVSDAEADGPRLVFHSHFEVEEPLAERGSPERPASWPSPPHNLINMKHMPSYDISPVRERGIFYLNLLPT